MRPWTLQIRSLTSSVRTRRPVHPWLDRKQWQIPPLPYQSYTTASQPNQQDDRTVESSPAPVSDPQHHTHAYSPISEHGQEGVGAEDVPAKWAPQSRPTQQDDHTVTSIFARASYLQHQVPVYSLLSEHEETAGADDDVPAKRAPEAAHEIISWPSTLPTSPEGALTTWAREYNRIKIDFNFPNQEISGHFVDDRHIDQPPLLDVQASEWVEAVLLWLDDGQTPLSSSGLASLADRSVDHIWTQVSLWLLYYDPQQMLRFLLATHVPTYVSVICISDSIRQLAAHIFRSQHPEKGIHMQQLADAFCRLAERDGQGVLSFYNPAIRSLILYCRDEQIQQIYKAVAEQGVRLHGHTYLHFATYFAKNDHFLLGFDALTKTYELDQVSVNSYAFLSNCSTILRRSLAEPDGLRETLRIVSTIADMGVIFDNPICDIIMLNAIEAGDLKTALAVYHSLRERGLQPTESTFSVLMKGCKMNIDDAQLLNDTIRDAVANVNVRSCEPLANQILNCLALHHTKHHPETAFNTLTEAYAQLYDMAPLRRLGMALPEVSQPRMTDEPVLSPNSHALNFMIGAYINHTLLQRPDPRQIGPLYSRWRQLVEAGDPQLANLAAIPHIANTFLCAFVRKSSGLLLASKVVRDMQRILPPSAGVEQAKPDIWTWNIFLHGFTRHGKTKLAEQVLTYMRSKGIEPDEVTWRTLTTGYMHMGDDEGALEALRRAERSGFAWDAWTERTVDRLRGKVEGVGQLRERWIGRSMDFTEDLKEGLGKRLTEVEGEEFADSPSELAERTDRYTPIV